jgi:hypothetical protein
MKEHFYASADFVHGSPGFWILLIIAVLLLAVFSARQMSFIPVDTETLTGFIIDESKGGAVSLKKYFPKPYSVQDLARGDQ